MSGEMFNRSGKRLVNLGEPLNFFFQGVTRPAAWDSPTNQPEDWDTYAEVASLHTFKDFLLGCAGLGIAIASGGSLAWIGIPYAAKKFGDFVYDYGVTLRTDSNPSLLKKNSFRRK